MGLKYKREIVKKNIEDTQWLLQEFESIDMACKKYIDDLHGIITKSRKFKDSPPVLVLSGGIDSMMLGCILKKYFGLEKSITIGCVKDTHDIIVSKDTAEKLGIEQQLIFVTLNEVLDNLHLCRGRNIRTVFNLVYYLMFKLCLKKINVKSLDLVQGDGADTLLGSIQTFCYRDVPWVMDNFKVDRDLAKTIVKQTYYAEKINPDRNIEKGSGHLFLEAANELGANPIMAFKHPKTLRWVNDLHYNFARRDIKLIPKKDQDRLFKYRRVRRDVFKLEDEIKELQNQIKKTAQDNFINSIAGNANDPNVPTEVRRESVTVPFKAVPVREAAAAVTVIFAVPSKETPLIVLAV